MSENGSAFEDRLMENLVTPAPGLPHTLEASLVRFARALRLSGVRVSTSELLEALQALELVGLEDRQLVRSALRATLVKSTEAQFLLERAFDLFFQPPEEKNRRLEETRRRQIEYQQQLAQATAELSWQGRPLELTIVHKETYLRLPEAEKKKLLDFLDRSGRGNKVDQGIQPLIEKLVAGHLERYRQQMDPGRKSPGSQNTGDEELDSLLEDLSIELEDARDFFLYQDFSRLSEKDLPKMAELTRRLARKLASRVSRRYRRSKKRRLLDLRRTIRANIRYGGLLFELRFRKKRLGKPRLLVIADVSGSMARYSTFVLEFIYGLSTVLSHIESFVFSDDLERITEKLGPGDFDRVVTSLVNDSREWGRGTNLAQALTSLGQTWSERLNPQTFVVIVSDGKTLQPEGAAHRLEQLREKVKEILWLNPLPAEEWPRFPALTQFQSFSHIFPCHNLAQLERIIEKELWRL